MITFNQKPDFQNAAAGGDNFTKNLIIFLKKKKIHSNFKLSNKTKLIFINNSKSFFFKKNLKYYLKKKRYHFNYKDLIEFKKKYPNIPIVHRVNDTDIARGTNFINKNIKKVNKLSDTTIFISNWIKRYFLKKKLKPKKYNVIENIANHKLFNLNKKKFWKKNQTFKIVTHHWSTNFQKGFAEYLVLDRSLATNKDKKINFYIIGNTPRNLNWKSAKLIKPLRDKMLANKLKKFDAYISGAKFEAGANHVIEALQCGLPVMYFKNSGSIEEQVKKKRYGIKTSKMKILNDLNTLIKNYGFYKKNIIKDFGSFDNKYMYLSYYKVIKNLLNE